MDDRNPQAKQMADASMVRNLAAQADAIWPQEEPIVRAHALPPTPRILDVGTGTGEIASRLARAFPTAHVIGVDLLEDHLALARTRYADLADRLEFRRADAFELPFAAHAFDLVVCRHVLQAIPHPERVLAEMVRVARPGGTLHLIPEDYDMIHAAPARLDVNAFWRAAPRAYAAASGTDLFIGRNAYHHLRKLPVTDIRYHYAMVDTLRVPRDTFATIFEAWRDGYVEPLAAALGWSQDDVRARFQATIDCIRDPDGYALWVVPIVTARVNG
ncbi:MAG: methyltransferase domain-containing protein [Deltaproteobacteria bacterium]|nr:methyltransferase domain-containing protein [Deltaproteobacteria bacterium]